MAFQGRGAAFEGSWFRAEESMAVQNRIAQLVREGRLPSTALAAAEAASSTHGAFSEVPTTTRGRHQAEWIYQHQKGNALPAPSTGEKMTVGTRISLGRAKWTVEDASVFSVSDGKRLAQTPVKDTSTPWEKARFNRIRAAAAETPLIAGYRLLPELTPGRAFLWGSILAAWGTMATFKLAAMQLGIDNREDAAGVMRETMAPLVSALAARLEPCKAWLSIPMMTSAEVSEGELATRLRSLLGAQR